MGEVYRARDPRLQRDIAIKILPAFVSRDPERLRAMAAASAGLGRPDAAREIVRVLEDLVA